MSAERFLDRLEEQGLLETSILNDLRQQVAEIGDVGSDAVAQLLVDNGYLTRFQASKILKEIHSPATKPPRPAAGEAARPSNPAPSPPPTPHGDDLGLAALSDDQIDAPSPAPPLSPPGEAKKEKKKRRAAPALQPLDPEEELLTPLDSGPPAPASSLLDEGLTPLDTGSPLMPAKRGFLGGRRGKRSQWDSPLILLGGGVLALLIIAFVVLKIALDQGSASEMFQAAEEDYRNLSYSQAIAKYDKFLDDYSGDPNAALARIRREMARLHIAVEQSTDPAQGLAMAREVLPKIEKEEQFAEARDELASLLPEIAEKFVAQAKKAVLDGQIEQAEQLANQTEEAMVLVNNPSYISTRFRKSQEARISRIEEDLALVRRDINRDRELNATLLAISQHVDAGQTVEAYERRKELLRKYPGLETNEQLRAAVRQIAEREQTLVEVVQQPLDPATGPPDSLPTTRIVFAPRRGSQANVATDQMALVLARGAVYGLEAATGKVLWRYFVGHASTIQPATLPSDAGPDALVVDASRGELVRIDGRSGQPDWRLPLGEQMAAPVVTDERIYVTTLAGRVLEVDPLTGRSQQQARIPQSLPVSPGADSRRPHIYQVGEHSNLYVLSKDSLQCNEVFYLGHKSGSIEVAPAVVLGQLFVAENAGANFSLLHILGTDASGLGLKRAQDPIRLDGRVILPPVHTGRLIAFVTDRGAIYVFDVDPAKANTPVMLAAQRVATSSQPILSYAVLQNGMLWTGDDRVSKYQIQTSRGELVREWVKDDGPVFLAPPQIFGEAMVRIRRSSNSPGVQVSAVRADTNELIWETDLGVSGNLITRDNAAEVSYVSARGALFPLDPQSLQASVREQPQVEGISGGAFTEKLPLSNGQTVLVSATQRNNTLLYDPSRSAGVLRPIQLAAPADEITATPVPFLDGLLVPLRSGRVELYDPNTGTSRTHPFQPPLEGGSQIQWTRPAVAGNEFVVADDRRTLYRVSLEGAPQSHLAEKHRVSLNFDLTGSLAAVENAVFGTARARDRDSLVRLTLPDLKQQEVTPLEGRVVWGPETIGDQVLLATEQDGLLCWNAQQQQWAFDLEGRQLAGRPTVAGEQLLVATVDGSVFRLNRQTGELLQETTVPEPLGGSPLLLNDRLAVTGSDGTLHVLPNAAP